MRANVGGMGAIVRKRSLTVVVSRDCRGERHHIETGSGLLPMRHYLRLLVDEAIEEQTKKDKDKEDQTVRKWVTEWRLKNVQ